MQQILGYFGISAPVLSQEQLSGGRIHGTYRVRTTQGNFIVQHVHPTAFPDPEAVTENSMCVAAHIRSTDPAQTTLHFYRTADGHFLHDGWRVMDEIPGKPPEISIPAVREAGRAFGAFQKSLLGLDAGQLRETLPGFHDTPARFEALRAAAGGLAHCTADVQETYSRLMALREDACKLLKQPLPRRIIHGDTKLENLLFGADGKALAVIDLDTVMPGLAAYDFGDAIRSLHRNASAPDPALIGAFLEGFCSGADFLTEPERASLLPGVVCITAELAARYLTDHLTGNSWFHAPDSAAKAAKLTDFAYQMAGGI